LPKPPSASPRPGHERGRVMRASLPLAAAVVLLFLANLAVGPAGLPPGELLAGALADPQSAAGLILLEIRLPRAILALLIGATLGLAGAAMQGYLRNPLADPTLIGVSGGAAFGAVVAFYFGIAALWSYALPLFGMAGAAGAAALLLLLARRDSGALALILAGIAVNAFAGALTALALNLAPSPYAALEIVFWMLGSVADRSFEHVALALPPMLLGWLLLASTARALDALTLGEETARSLGFAAGPLRLKLVSGLALSVGAAVAVAGSIGFVGLVVPHLLRRLAGGRPGRLLGLSMLGGAAMLLAADALVRIVPTDVELKLGVVTALVGAPFFLHLIRSARRNLA